MSRQGEQEIVAVRMRRILLLTAALALLPAPAFAQHDHGGMKHEGPAIPIYNASFAVPHLDVLAGDSVTWHNASLRAHDVAAEDRSFASPRLLMDSMYIHRFDTPGTYAYLCRLHPTMRGGISVHRLLLDRATEPAAPGRPYTLQGRAALPDGATVSVQSGGVEQATATVQGGAFSATVTPSATATYTAVAGADAAPPVQVLVLDRKVAAAQRGRTVVARVTPAAAGATVVLQLRLKERFGWWPVKAGRTKADGTVRFKLDTRRKVRARVLLTASDEATELARSATFRLR
jgi:plastocyanin